MSLGNQFVSSHFFNVNTTAASVILANIVSHKHQLATNNMGIV